MTTTTTTRMKSVVLLPILFVLSAAGAKSYDGFSVLRTSPLSPDQARALADLDHDHRFEIWKFPRPGFGSDIMTHAENLLHLENIMHEMGVAFETMIEDVEKLCKQDEMKSLPDGESQIDWENYYDHNALNAYVDQLASQYSFVESVSIGKSYEGRDMRVLQILKAGPGKPNVWIEAGIHAREWIAPALATYLARELVERDGSSYIDHLNFHILPSANPDGYEFTRESDRFWRKTRSETGSVSGCRGADGNRNFDIAFGGYGSSSSECSDVYHGSEPFSEPETANIRDYLLSMTPEPILAVNLHSYSQLWMYPYAYDYNTYPDNVQEIIDLGEEAVAAVEKVHGTVFDPICASELYPASGTAADWYKQVAKARFAFTIELRDTGYHGFMLPPDQIIPSGEELWAGLQVVLDKMVALSK